MRNPLTQHARHPQEKELLLFIDGELNARQARPIASHLERCRKCRAKMHALEESLGAFVEYRQCVILPAAGAPPKGWSEFPALLDRASAGCGVDNDAASQ